jgi:plastocyanin
VKGTVRLPGSARSGRLHPGYWRIENGSVAVRSAGAKAGTMVVLEGISGAHAPPAKTVTVEISGLDAQPRLVVVGPGSVVEFRNVDKKVTHELSTPANTSFMPIERLNPGTFRHQRFSAPGGYLVRCSDYPHLAISVIVVDSPYHATVDDRGGFTLPSVPDGKATLKVWSMGGWVHQESIDVTGAKQELTIKVAAAKGAKETEMREPESKDGEGGSTPE